MSWGNGRLSQRIRLLPKVWKAGFEPATTASQMQRSTGLSYSQIRAFRTLCVTLTWHLRLSRGFLFHCFSCR